MYFEHALAEDRLHVLRVGLGREDEAALELALETLVERELLSLLVLRRRAGALDRDRVIGDLERELLLLVARNVELDDDSSSVSYTSAAGASTGAKPIPSKRRRIRRSIESSSVKGAHCVMAIKPPPSSQS